MKLPFFFPILLLIFGGCNPIVYTYTFSYTPEEPLESIAMKLEKILENEYYKVDIVLKRNIEGGTAANVDSVHLGLSDFSFTENHVPFQSGVKTVAVFYPKILHLFYRSDVTPNSFHELMENKRVYIGPVGSGSYLFMMDLIDFFNVDHATIVADSSEGYEVIATFSHLLNEEQLRKFQGWQLFSLGESDQLNGSSVADAITLRFPKVRPFIIPKYTYGSISSEATLTLASDVVLVAREGEGVSAVLDLTRALFKYQNEFATLSPLIAREMREDFDRTQLTFPLHEGARQYLDRDEPSFFEKYAEPIGVSFSILVAIISGVISLSKWQQQKKKDRVDVFYKALIEIKNKIPAIQSKKEIHHYIQEVQQSQNKAFDLLINEKLEANDSFRIFMELTRETLSELKVKYRSIS